MAKSLLKIVSYKLLQKKMDPVMDGIKKKKNLHPGNLKKISFFVMQQLKLWLQASYAFFVSFLNEQ